MLTCRGQRCDNVDESQECYRKAVLLVVMGLDREAFLFPQCWLSHSCLPWNISFQDFPLCKIAPPTNPVFNRLVCGYLTAFWLLKIETVWFYSTLQLQLIRDYLTWVFPEMSRTGNWVSSVCRGTGEEGRVCVVPMGDLPDSHKGRSTQITDGSRLWFFLFTQKPSQVFLTQSHLPTLFCKREQLLFCSSIRLERTAAPGCWQSENKIITPLWF